MRASRDRRHRESQFQRHHTYSKGNYSWIFLQYSGFNLFGHAVLPLNLLLYIGATPKERRLVSDAQDKPNGVCAPFVQPLPASAAREVYAVLRAGDDVEVIHAVR
jgi:hypothetical protein